MISFLLQCCRINSIRRLLRWSHLASWPTNGRATTNSISSYPGCSFRRRIYPQSDHGAAVEKRHFWIPVELGTGTKPWLHPGYFLRPGIAFHEAILKYLRIFWNNAPTIFWRYRKHPTACQKGVGWHQDIIRWWFNYIAWSYRTAESRKMTAGPNGSCRLSLPILSPIFSSTQNIM